MSLLQEDEMENGMNRAQRRALANGKNQHSERVVPMPKFFDQAFVFKDMDHLLDRIEHGYLDVANGEYVLRGGADEFTAIVPNLNSWISMWKRLDMEFSLNHDLSALVRLANCLQHDVRISQSLVKACRAVIREEKRLFRLLPRDDIAKQAKIEQTAQYMRGM